MTEKLDPQQLTLVEGLAEFGDLSHASETDYMGSFTLVKSAYKIEQRADNYISWQTAPVPKEYPLPPVVFIWTMALGFGEQGTMPPAGQFDLLLNGRKICSFEVTKETSLWHGEDCRLLFEAKRWDEPCGVAVAGLAYLLAPRRLLDPGYPAELKVVADNTNSPRWFRLDWPHYGKSCQGNYLERGLRLIADGEIREQQGELSVYWGDLHGHTGSGNKGCGHGVVDNFYTYARDVSRLDFCCLSDHDYDVEGVLWQHRLEKCAEYNQEGRFVTFPGYEFTSRIYGHRNVYYRREGKTTPLNCLEGMAPDVLWQHLRDEGVPAITVPHHTAITRISAVVDWSYYDPELDRLAEIFSFWGCSEYYGHPYMCILSDNDPAAFLDTPLARGYKYGFIASQDSHDGKPGNCQAWTALGYGPPRRWPVGSGLVAALAPDLTREALWEALWDRRVYATTGCRLVLDWRGNGAIMGSLLPRDKVGDALNLVGLVRSETPIERLEVVADGRVVARELCFDRQAAIEYTAEPDPGAEHYYYLRVFQKDGEMAWSSPIWVTD